MQIQKKLLATKDVSGKKLMFLKGDSGTITSVSDNGRSFTILTPEGETKKIEMTKGINEKEIVDRVGKTVACFDVYDPETKLIAANALYDTVRTDGILDHEIIDSFLISAYAKNGIVSEVAFMGFLFFMAMSVVMGIADLCGFNKYLFGQLNVTVTIVGMFACLFVAVVTKKSTEMFYKMTKKSLAKTNRKLELATIEGKDVSIVLDLDLNVGGEGYALSLSSHKKVKDFSLHKDVSVNYETVKEHVNTVHRNNTIELQYVEKQYVSGISTENYYRGVDEETDRKILVGTLSLDLEDEKGLDVYDLNHLGGGLFKKERVIKREDGVFSYWGVNNGNMFPVSIFSNAKVLSFLNVKTIIIVGTLLLAFSLFTSQQYLSVTTWYHGFICAILLNCVMGVVRCQKEFNNRIDMSRFCHKLRNIHLKM